MHCHGNGSQDKDTYCAKLAHYTWNFDPKKLYRVWGSFLIKDYYYCYYINNKNNYYYYHYYLLLLLIPSQLPVSVLLLLSIVSSSLVPVVWRNNISLYQEPEIPETRDGTHNFRRERGRGGGGGGGSCAQKTLFYAVLFLQNCRRKEPSTCHPMPIQQRHPTSICCCRSFIRVSLSTNLMTGFSSPGDGEQTSCH